MEINKVTAIYFSPTGHTRLVCRAIAGEFRAPVEEVDITNDGMPRARDFSENELVVVAVPAYGGRVPEPAAQRLIHFSGRNTPAIPVATFGNRAYDDTLRELGDILTGNGFINVAGAAAVTEHSIAPQFGMGRPDDKDMAELRSFAIRVRVKLGGLMCAANGRVSLSGDAPYKKYNGLPFKPVTGRNCTKCGTCARLCPVGAIDKENPAKTDGAKCITCMRCIKVCPENARSLGKTAQMAVAFKLKAVCATPKRNELKL